jgi:hypothetical protein
MIDRVTGRDVGWTRKTSFSRALSWGFYSPGRLNRAVHSEHRYCVTELEALLVAELRETWTWDVSARRFRPPLAAERQHAARDPVEPLDLPQADRDRPAGIFRDAPAGHVALQALEVELEGRERVADLVRELGGELTDRHHVPAGLDLTQHLSNLRDHQAKGSREPPHLVAARRWQRRRE